MLSLGGENTLNLCWSKMIAHRRKVVRFKPVQGRKTCLKHRGTLEYHKNREFKFNLNLIVIRIL